METMKIELTFSNETDPRYDGYETYYARLAEVILHHLQLKDDFMLEVDLIDDETIHRLNREYRKVDRPTDVISFAFEDANDFASLKGENRPPRDLGEIFISVETAARQAESYHHSFEREMAFLFTHGLLHLLGYDHMSEADEKIMFGIQDEIMKKMKL